ncbi:MAG: hypothetical protein WA151_15710 [Desulfatirhabdiaceae bacterium]
MRFLFGPAMLTAVFIAVGYTENDTSNSFLGIRHRFTFSSVPNQSFQNSPWSSRDDRMPVTTHMIHETIFKISAGYFE